jgi:hypothetical protein
VTDPRYSPGISQDLDIGMYENVSWSNVSQTRQNFFLGMNHRPWYILHKRLSFFHKTVSFLVLYIIYNKDILPSLWPGQIWKTCMAPKFLWPWHILPKVGSVTFKRNSVTCYRFCHVLRALTIKSSNVSYEPSAQTRKSNNDFHKPRAITMAISFLHSVDALCNHAKM